MEQSVLGLSLEMALQKLEAAGADRPAVEVTRSPRGEAPSGTLRVVRQRPGQWVVALFPDRAEGES